MGRGRLPCWGATMNDDIRPRGTVEVRCSSPGCNWRFWLGATDPRLPDGPFSCGANHTTQARFERAMGRLEEAGLVFCAGVGTGCGCAGGPDDGPGAVQIRLYDPALEFRYEHGGHHDNFSKGQFAVFEWTQLSELEQAPLTPNSYHWTDWSTASKLPAMRLPGDTEIFKEDEGLLQPPN